MKKRIVDYLMEAQDKYAIPKIVRLHGELWGESWDKMADKIADCVDLILPVYFSREAVSKALSQHQDQRVVLIEGVVATLTGAEGSPALMLTGSVPVSCCMNILFREGRRSYRSNHPRSASPHQKQMSWRFWRISPRGPVLSPSTGRVRRAVARCCVADRSTET